MSELHQDGQTSKQYQNARVALRLENLARGLLQELGHGEWNEETQTEDIDSAQVAAVVSFFEILIAANLGRP